MQKFLTLISQKRADLSLMLRRQAAEEQTVFEEHASALQEHHRHLEDTHKADIEEMRKLIMTNDILFLSL